VTSDSDLPTGTVTFLFTDIEGSTRLLQKLGDGYRAVQNRHAELIRKAIRPHGGREVRTEGDSFFVAFSSAPSAVGAAIDIQRAMAGEIWSHGEPLRVRIGMHTGEGVMGGDDYLGIDVNRAARIAAAGQGGQVLVSEATRGLVAHSLPEGVRVRDLGSHRLKDIEHPERIHDLIIEGLPSDFPPVRSLDAAGPTNLPPQRSSFVGREREVAEVTDLLERTRLATLTGPGGSGKTRLALRVAEGQLDRFDDGVFLVDLGAVVDADLVSSAIVTTLDVREEPGRSLVDTLSDHLRDRRMLLIMDNMEQVVEAAPLVGQLLDAAPGLQILASSRVALKISGEQEFHVRPLALPRADQIGDLTALRACEAVMLFVERAGAVQRGFRLTEETAPKVAGITTRLDGLPLAIELAANRAKVLAPAELLDRLERRLPVLTGGTRDAPERQRTLRATIEWSHDLLEPGEQRLFARLGVFAGGWTLPAAETVCGEGLGIDVLDGLTALVDHNLVRRGSRAPERIRMLETIRELALERLEASEEEEDVRRRHAGWVLAMVEASEPVLLRDRTHLDLLEAEHDNIRAALQWSIDRGEAEVGLRMVGSLWRFWQLRNHLAEGRRWTEGVLSLRGAKARTAARARALGALGSLAYYLRDPEHVAGPYEESLAIFREVGDQKGEADAAYNLAFARLLSTDTGGARELLLLAEGIYREVDDQVQMAHAKAALGHIKVEEGDMVGAEPLIEEAREAFVSAGDTWGVVLTSGELASLALRTGNLQRARAAAVQSLEGGLSIGGQEWSAVAIQGLAVLAIREGNVERGVRLAGAVDRLREIAGGEAPRAIVLVEEPLDLARGKLPPERVESLWEEGRAMTLDEAVALAREDP
jgi:predicted ATPase/class 3 adenylate cyclase